MASRAHVLRRGARSAERDFPARPTLPPEWPCDGVAFILEPGAPGPDLRPLRQVISGLWRGPLEAGDGAPEVVAAAFASPAPLTGAWPGALPLVAARGSALASFSEEMRRPRIAAAGPPRRLELMWNGQRRQLSLDALTPLSLAGLWDAPAITLHRPMARAAHPAAAGGASAAGEKPLAKVSKAKVVMAAEGEALGATVAERMRALEERTRLSSIFRQMLRLSVNLIGGGVKAGGRQGAAAAGNPAPKEPGVLENLMGWVRWHTPLGNRLKGRFSERLKLVEKLIAAGDMDGALKLALALGGGLQALKNRFPNALPGARANLDFNVGGWTGAAPIFGGDAFHNLQQRYLSLARKLEAEGDHRRAAYIYSQLLNDHRQAVTTLEAGGLFREGAKLAIDADLPPATTIRLLFKAGELDAALALAKRTACFDQLAEESRGKDGAFHGYVITAWTEMLIATGQPLRALQVTDALTAGPTAPAPLLAARARWLASALAMEPGAGEPGAGFGAEISIRALLSAPWGEDRAALPAGLADFPDTAIPAGPFAAVLRGLQQAARGEGEDARQTLLDLLGALARLGEPNHPEQTGFWLGPAGGFAEAFTRALLEIAADRLGQKEQDALQAVLKKAELNVLATDIRKLRKLHAPPPAKSRTWRLPPAASTRPPVRLACALGNGSLLIWRESRLLQLLDRHGASLWQRNVSDLVALIPVGTSPNVILVQAERDGAHLLTRFATHERAFHPIGRVTLSAAHDVTSESQWLVQIGGEIGALDLAKLCAREPEIKFLWASALTDRVRAIAFGHHPAGASWITCDISPHRAGVVEIWSLPPTGKLDTSLCLPGGLSSKAPPPPPTDWYWTPFVGGHRIAQTAASGGYMAVSPWSSALEKRALTTAAERREAGMAGIDSFQSCDLGRAYITVRPGDPEAEGALSTISIRDPDAKAAAFVLEHAREMRLTCLARPAAPVSGRQAIPAPRPYLFADEAGRLIVADLTTLNLTVI